VNSEVSTISIPNVDPSDIPLECHDASNIRLIDSQNLTHNSKVELVLSGGGFLTKNSKNKNSEYFENSRISLTDNSFMLKYHCHDQIPFFVYIP
jgi:hypothetical protein